MSRSTNHAKTAGGAAAPGRRGSWRAYAGMYGFVGLLHVVGWGVLLLLVLPGNYHVGEDAFGIGLAITAYTLGMRHAFDADHIAAIDNTTRKLREGQGRPPVSVGFWFSLGHSTVVVVMVAAIAFGVHALARQVTDQDSFVSRYAGLFGAAVSGIFLLVIGLLNLVVLLGILTVFRRMRQGDYDEAELEAQLARRGLMNRFFGGLMRFVSRPAHIYPVGVLFGLGFDTVSEVALLAIAGSAVAGGLSWYVVLVLPVLFAAGMSLLDTTDGAFMNGAYGWAFARPVRKVFYNLAVTTLSVVVAVGIGLVELVRVFSTETGISSGLVGWVSRLDLNDVGFAIVGFFLAAWLAALAVWRFGRLEDRWAATPAGSSEPPD